MIAPLILLFIKGHVLQYYKNIKKRSFSALQCDHIVVKMSYEEGIDNNKVKEFANNINRVTNDIVPVSILSGKFEVILDT